MPDLNSVTIAGRLCVEPELKYLPSGAAVCTLLIANTRHYKTKDGEKKDETCFINVVVWNKSAEWAGEAWA